MAARLRHAFWSSGSVLTCCWLTSGCRRWSSGSDCRIQVAAAMKALSINPPLHTVHLNIVYVLVMLQDHTVAARDGSVDVVANAHSLVLHVNGCLTTQHSLRRAHVGSWGGHINGCGFPAPRHVPGQRHRGRCPKVSSPLVEGPPRAIAPSADLARATAEPQLWPASPKTRHSIPNTKNAA